LQKEYDFVVLADVIEHVADPLEFLKQLRTIVSLNTKILISVPNIAFGAIRIELLNGIFDYVDSGIRERTHLRFFTLKTIYELVNELGMNLERIYFLQYFILHFLK